MYNELVRRCNKLKLAFYIYLQIGIITDLMTELELHWIEAVSVISDEGGLTGLEPFPLNMSKDIARGDHGTIVENFNDGADKVNPLQNYAGLETFIVRFFF